MPMPSERRPIRNSSRKSLLGDLRAVSEIMGKGRADLGGLRLGRFLGRQYHRDGEGRPVRQFAHPAGEEGLDLGVDVLFAER